MRNVLQVTAAVAALVAVVALTPAALAAEPTVAVSELKGVVLRAAPVAPTPADAVPAPAPAAAFAPVTSPAELARRAAVKLQSRSALIVRADNGEVLYRKNVDRDMPIASITKLMTAMIVLDAGQPLDENITVTSADIDRLKNTHSRLAVGTRLTRGDFLQLALMASENRAASALARDYPGGRAAAVAAMNRKAREIGMTRTTFVDGTGLSAANRSSPVDLVRLVKAADAYPDIRRYSTKTQHVVKVGRRLQVFNNTNPLVKSPDWSIGLTKTGYISEAGRCLVMQAKIAELPVIMVLMDSVGTKTRLGDANRVRKWIEAAIPARAPAPGVLPMARADVGA